MNWQKIAVTSIKLCLILVSILVLPSTTLAQGPPPRPTPGNPSGGPASGSAHDNHDRDTGTINGDITGTVIDLSTGLPGAGLTVQINDIPIRTDASGRFSLTDIADGDYWVSLNIPAEFTPAQPGQTVTIANRNKVDLTLGYYSITPPVEAAPTLEESPQELPGTGGELPWLNWGRGDTIGIVLFLTGFALLFKGCF